MALAYLSLLIWLVLWLGRGSFWRVSRALTSHHAHHVDQCRVIAIIPARDEGDVIAAALQSLKDQAFAGELRVIVVNDNSTDDTARIARDAGVTVVDGSPLAKGWTGKLWALQQGISVAERLDADYFLLTDADIQHDARSVAALVERAEVEKLDLVSHMVRLPCSSVAEKLTIPAFVFFFFMLYPPSWIQSEKWKTAGAAGGCILIRPAMLGKIGGLGAIRSEVIDDCSLAAAVKQAGGKLWLGLSDKTRSIRPYTGLGEIGKMISRSAFRQLNHSVWRLLMAVAGLILTYVFPVILGMVGMYPAIGAWILMTGCYLPMIRFYGLNPLWALTLPITALFYLGATLHSAAKYWSGHGGEWKGRAQDQGSLTQ